MSSRDVRELFHGYKGNPILTGYDFPTMVNSAFNPGAILFRRATLLVRVEERTGLSRLDVATIPDGLAPWKVEPSRGMIPQPDLASRSTAASRTAHRV